MRHTWCILVIFLLFSSTDPFVRASEVKCNDPLIELLVSPLVTKNKLRVLQINWDVKDWTDGDWVALYIGNPDAAPSFVTKTLFPSGWVTTQIMERRRYTEPNYQPTCLGYWAAYYKANATKPLVSSCLKTNPTWMEELKDTVGKLKLNDLFLPGTHDSAAFKIAYSPYKLTRYDKYTFAQDETVMEQLIHGARILDLRIGFYNGVFWSNHGIARVHPFEPIIHDIKDFVNNTNEIVILDFHNFPIGFRDNKTHELLVKYVQKFLGPWLVPPQMSWRASLNSLWTSGKRVIFAYNDPYTVSRFPNVLFPGVSQKWGNALTVAKLKEFFVQVMSRPKPSTAWSAMAELTPNAWTILTDEHGGLRVMAESANKEVTRWFRYEWGGRCNAVAVDFIRSSGIVNTAIWWNQLRANGIRSC